MSSPSKPKTPKHEKLQAAHASKMFSEGTKVRANMGDSYMADMRKNSTGLKESRGSAQNAYGSKQNLVARRRAGRSHNVSTRAPDVAGLARFPRSSGAGTALGGPRIPRQPHGPHVEVRATARLGELR